MTTKDEPKSGEPTPVAVMHPDNKGKTPDGVKAVYHDLGPTEGYFEGVEAPDGTVTW